MQQQVLYLSALDVFDLDHTDVLTMTLLFAISLAATHLEGDDFVALLMFQDVHIDRSSLNQGRTQGHGTVIIDKENLVN